MFQLFLNDIGRMRPPRTVTTETLLLDLRNRSEICPSHLACQIIVHAVRTRRKAKDVRPDQDEGFRFPRRSAEYRRRAGQGSLKVTRVLHLSLSLAVELDDDYRPERAAS